MTTRRFWWQRGMMFALHAVRERAVSRSRNNFDWQVYLRVQILNKKGDVKSIELYNYAGGVETRLRTEILWADLFRQIKPWNARWRVRLGSCLLWRRAVCGCAQILYRVPSPRNVISGHTMSNRHVWGQIQNLFIRPFFLPFSFSSPFSPFRLLHIYTLVLVQEKSRYYSDRVCSEKWSKLPSFYKSAFCFSFALWSLNTKRSC